MDFPVNFISFPIYIVFKFSLFSLTEIIMSNFFSQYYNKTSLANIPKNFQVAISHGQFCSLPHLLSSISHFWSPFHGNTSFTWVSRTLHSPGFSPTTLLLSLLCGSLLFSYTFNFGGSHDSVFELFILYLQSLPDDYLSVFSASDSISIWWP